MSSRCTSFVDGHGLRLAEALGIKRGEIVAFVGGGGKTSAMFRLATELESQGWRTLVTTTTHIYPPATAEFQSVILESTLPNLVAAVRIAMARHPLVVVARGLDVDGKLVGISPAWVAELRDQLPATNLLVEADGSKGRPFKAPAMHEPVIPPLANLVVPVVGLSAVDQPLSHDWVHRPELVAELAGTRLGEILTPEVIATVLLHSQGSTRGAPAGARIIPLLNQADDDARLEEGRRVACELIQRGSQRVVISALRAGETRPVREVAVPASDGETPDRRKAVSAIVLAAGEGRRMGRLKLNLRLEGKSLLRRVVEAALATRVDEVLVVLGHGAAELEQELPADSRVHAVCNPDYARGQSSSLKAGIAALSQRAEGAIFLLGDQPLLRAEAIQCVVNAFQSSNTRLVQALYRGQPGHPVLFARELFPELLAVTGDEGGREVLARHRNKITFVPLHSDLPSDVDTLEDYERLASRFSEGKS